MARMLSDEEVKKIEACFVGADFMGDLTHSLREARRERDAARVALRWLADRYVRFSDHVPSRGEFSRYGGGISDAEWAAHVTPALGEEA
jgi:hypothetical protein